MSKAGPALAGAIALSWASAALLLLACSSEGPTPTDSPGASGAGGSSVMNTGGVSSAGAGASGGGSGGTNASGGPPSTGGSGAGAATDGGTSASGGAEGGSGAAAGSAGAMSTSDGGAAGAAAGGAATGGSAGSASSGTAGVSGGGTVGGAGAGGMPSYPTTPPVTDKNSKVPVSKPPAGYTVEGNYAYGPLTAQRLDVMYPTAAGPKGTQLLPVVLMFHGGAWIHSYTNDYGSGKDHMSTFFDRFLAHGFIVCNAEYRVNDGTVDGAPAPAAVEDALLAAEWCWKYMDYFKGDRARFVVTGASAGGHLALMVGMTTPAAMLGPTSPANFEVAAIVDGYGPADIEAELNGVAKDWIPANLANRAAIAKKVNPITYVRADVPPLIVVQGSEDDTAPVADSHRLVDLLKAAGADASMHEVVGAGHGYTTGVDGWPDAEKAMFDWLKARGIGK